MPSCDIVEEACFTLHLIAHNSWLSPIAITDEQTPYRCYTSRDALCGIVLLYWFNNQIIVH